MTKKEFEAIVEDAVENGADRQAAEAYVRAGFKVDEKADGAKSFGEKARGKGKGKQSDGKKK